MMTVDSLVYYCGFCGKTDKEVEVLIVGPSPRPAYICDECVDQCNIIIAETRYKKELEKGLFTDDE